MIPPPSDVVFINEGHQVATEIDLGEEIVRDRQALLQSMANEEQMRAVADLETKYQQALQNQFDSHQTSEQANKSNLNPQQNTNHNNMLRVTLNHTARKQEVTRINKENQKILQKLRQVRPSVPNVSEHEKFYKRQMQFKMNASKFRAKTNASVPRARPSDLLYSELQRKNANSPTFASKYNHK